MSWLVDPMHTQVEFAVKHFGMTFDMLADGKLIVGDEVKLAIEVEVLEQHA
ncbi:MAG TPA: hypothetical protein VNL16_07270 [Chloroflexota bacterium]|nr:hypothetical protein [Chloroflexota bacterium]